MPIDLTDKQYWEERQEGCGKGSRMRRASPAWEWMPIVLNSLRDRTGCSFLELGCSPGEVSASICAAIPLRAEGVDFADASEQYLSRMRMAGVPEAVFNRCDIREFRPGKRYDIVASFGLVEHFSDFETILDIHDELLAPGGLCIVEVPHFRHIQFLYHTLFDRKDLSRHNLRVMELEVFRSFAARKSHRVLHLDYCGKLRFWGADSPPSPAVRAAHNTSSRAVQAAASLLGSVFPANHRWLAPWILYIGQKPADIRNA
jgi:SAM-dependent methyltransferase